MYVDGTDFPPFYYETIQSAIDEACDWTTIIVSPGTYYENINFLTNCTVASRFHTTGDTSFISQTIIDGDSLTAGDSLASVVRFISGQSPCATLKGFTIRNGTGTIYIDKGVPGRYGGGIYCKDSSPTIMNNIIIGDTVTTSGGGIYCHNSSAQILNNLIKQNEADWDGGGIAIENYQSSSAPILSNNVVVDNAAGNRGGGIYYWGNPFITNNTIDGNSAGGAGAGGGIYVNYAQHGWIQNNIITNSLSGGGIFGPGPEVMSYNDVWNNVDGDFGISYPEGVGDTSWGENRNETPCDTFYNIIRDPYFYDGYHLCDSSACIDAGDNEAPYVLSFDFEGNPRVGDFVDMGAYENQSGSGGGGGAKIAAGDTTSESKSAAGTPKEFELSQNFPNPFNPATTITYGLPKDTWVKINIYNILGQKVTTLVDEYQSAGYKTVAWNGRNEGGEVIASGIYFCRMKAGEFTDSKKMVILK